MRIDIYAGTVSLHTRHHTIGIGRRRGRIGRNALSRRCPLFFIWYAA